MTLHSRPKRVAEEIRTQLAEIMANQIKDPRIFAAPLVTVAHVDVARDLEHATAHISVFGDDDQTKSVMDALDHSKPFIKRLLSDRLRMKHMPLLHFRLDEAGRTAAAINTLLKKIERENTAEPAATFGNPDDAPAS